ncbi:DHHC zinc finger domain-containing protein [Toxoplasma gondii FOU]|uniref:Palmitoyltransferase n=1 Tax=Toxoplasma gondii FOU TaxID=943167 RepID=A0A086L0Z7_TOXGO|nr:DHHC zinc finger domain-containing protein [Toxoplasma gondii FOU]
MHSSLFPLSSPWDSHAGPHSSLPFSAASPAPRDVYEGDGAAAQLTSNSGWPSLTGGASVCAFLRLFLARGDLLFWVVCVDLALYLLLLLSDPGIHPKRKRGSSAVEELMEILSSPETHADTLAALDLSRLCRTCWIYRPLRTKHCSICDRCVDGFDHHCVWLYNCVGSLNARLFTAWLLLHSLTQVGTKVCSAACSCAEASELWQSLCLPSSCKCDALCVFAIHLFAVVFCSPACGPC